MIDPYTFYFLEGGGEYRLSRLLSILNTRLSTVFMVSLVLGAFA